MFSSISTSVTDNTIYYWHLQLSQTSSVEIHNLVSIVTFDNISKFSLFDFSICNLAKRPTLFLTTYASLCDTPFGLIHYDTWALFPLILSMVVDILFYLMMTILISLEHIFLNIVLPYLKLTLIL